MLLRRALPPCFLLVLAACASEEPAPSVPPNVVVITLDTLRADRLSCYGGPAHVSPHLDDLAATATRFERCLSTAPWTAPAHASLFTGQHPFEHGVYSFEVNKLRRNVHSLPPEAVTLAELLVNEGYATAGIAANTVYLHERFELGQGFQLWDVERQYGEGVNQRAFDWIDQQGEEPFFLFLNYMDTHRPYNVEPLEGEAAFENPSNQLLDELIERVMEQGEDPPAALVAKLEEQYARAIRNLDAHVGALLAGLQERDLLEDAVIVITSDHGEYFGEHMLVEHSKDVYIEALHVPLIVKYPRQREGEVVNERVSLVNVPRLVLDAFPAAWRDRLEGRFPYAAGEHPVLAENHYSRSKDILHPVYGQRFRRVRTTLYQGDHKFLHSSDGAHELYDLATDPAETNNLFDPGSDLAKELSAALAAFQEVGRARPKLPPPEEAMTPAELEEMRALGYAGDESEDG